LRIVVRDATLAESVVHRAEALQEFADAWRKQRKIDNCGDFGKAMDALCDSPIQEQESATSFLAL
jgi:hypothetical protein